MKSNQLSHRFPFQALTSASLIVDAEYEGGNAGNISDDVISKLIPGTGNSGGFRFIGSVGNPKLVVLYSSERDVDWPDSLDMRTGVFTYFGDNRKPGVEMHDTPKGGNRLLRAAFEFAHQDALKRKEIPPFLVFTQIGTGRNLRFRGLAVPGTESRSENDLAAIWRSRDGVRFQNYRANFTILDVQEITRECLSEMSAGNYESTSMPLPWQVWRYDGLLTPLKAFPTTLHRSVELQLPVGPEHLDLLSIVIAHFKNQPKRFIKFAAFLLTLLDGRFRPTYRDTDLGEMLMGQYLVGPESDGISLPFVIQSRCDEPGVGISASSVNELIAKLYGKSFAVLVTTGHVGQNAYGNIRARELPIVFITGRDVVEILIRNGFGDKLLLEKLLLESYK